MESKEYLVGDIAKRLNVSARTVRYYEELGLISSERSQCGYRIFNETQIERLKTILALKEIGMPLEEISHLLHLRQHGVTGSESAPKLLEYLRLKYKEMNNVAEKYNTLLKELSSVIKIVEDCKACNNTTEETTCERCVDKRTHHHTPALLKTLL